MASTPLLSSCYSLATIPTNFLCKTSSLPPTLFHPHSLNHRKPEFRQYPNRIIRGFGERAEPRGSSKNNLRINSRRKKLTPKANESGVEEKPPPSSAEVECVGTGLDVECVVNPSDEFSSKDSNVKGDEGLELLGTILEWGLLISPFFFWGTAMVAMKEVLPKTGPFFVSAFRLVPAGLMLVGFAASKGRNFPSGFTAWLSITLFALVDATCFQGFLAEGLQRTSAGLGSVIIDSQPLTVAVLAALLFGESIGSVGAAGLVLGVIGLLLLEVPALSFDNSNFSLWGSGEWWMFLAAQSMAVGTVMVRWVSKYSDPVMATGWHMVIGGLPLVAISILNHEPIISGSLMELTSSDLLALLYTSIFGSAISYGVYFYNATRGSLTKLSSLTFLTPMFASIFGSLYLDETFTPVQLVGAFVTVAAIYMVNYKSDAK
ncbi:WAT1-related protein, chloroplastic [Capsicum chacoense]|uniref:WAT1-related protein, chloroplastic n=1 Tax=Capsicum annuum TaxID=4072 RepID=A0A1U8FQ16_CAPAN|nr:WAT1-related protein At3g02690, chloroplastic [Capsicum annuum]KAF3623293.1 WAT1-related protein, chloroplastic [Capsicum annuum]KAF3624214.1 WAT1-related protein, chloroplastic [Capsicum annuum]PHT89220.1 WAT1-related protein, chloroplastic [Capsicum annuum]